MELFKLLGKITIDNEQANEDIDETTQTAEKSNSRIGTAFTKIGGAAKVMAKAGAVAIGAIATGVGALAKMSVNYYAEYEQLVGGVETLFGESGANLIEYANKAYKTAGLSANEYMDTVTSFSASLISSLGGDTEKATAYADMAITDMSDNANKMGTDMSLIQNAYQGFAKQNYTMLDNLKLGYGGTQTEMQRLLTDAQKISGIKYDISSFADITEAIHVVQEEMGIAGATADEAGSTISGSINMMKGAWTNFLTGMADPNQDFDALLNNLVESVITVADLLIPRIASTLPRLVTGLMGLMNTLGQYMPEILTGLLPPLLEGAAQLLTQLVIGIPELFQSLMPALIESVKLILSTAFGMAGVDTASPLIQSIMGSFINLYTVISDVVTNHILPTCQLFIDMLVRLYEDNKIILMQIAELFRVFSTILGNVISTVVTWITSVISENMTLIQAVIQSGLNIISGIVQFFTALLKGDWEGMWEAVKTILSSAVEYIVNVLNLYMSIASNIIAVLKNLVSNAFEFIKQSIISKLTQAKDMVVSIFTAIKDTINEKIEIAKNIVSTGIEMMKRLFNFEWSLPALKLPHISVSGSFSLSPLSAPSFGIEWYKDGGIMTQPTAFGINPSTGKVMVGGEAGAEAIAPIETLQSYVSEAVQSQNTQLVSVLNLILMAIYNLDEGLADKLYNAFSSMKLQVNEREFARLVRVV